MPALNTDGSKSWAVIIAINDYKTAPLRGCVSDAKMVVEYLRGGLNVPEDHIELLLSGTDSKECTVPGSKPPGEPIRTNIVKEMLGLSTNPDINHGDNIIIYFAGHGTTYNCADYYGYEDKDAAQLGKIDALCPIDRAANTGTPANNVDDANSSVTKDPPVPDISDREINTILAEIARNKGNHITFILDCCFSASLTRAPKEGVRRSISPLPSSSIPHMFRLADETLKDIAGYQSIKDARWRANMDSHVVLAACKEYEEALELEGTQGNSGLNGVFTQALIPAFKSADLNDKSMTYYDLLATLSDNPAQNPVIAGKQRHSRLWFQDRPVTKSDARTQGSADNRP